ncbi:MAG: hypothetical protein EBZ50_16045 [Alphaproteobacteria bacterium]|nr:hypothetical protein [Alphaproteobacteria bacterium]
MRCTISARCSICICACGGGDVFGLRSAAVDRLGEQFFVGRLGAGLQTLDRHGGETDGRLAALAGLGEIGDLIGDDRDHRRFLLATSGFEALVAEKPGDHDAADRNQRLKEPVHAACP